MRVDVRPADRVDIAVLVPLADQARRSVRTERGGAALLADLGLDGDVVSPRVDSPDDSTCVWSATIDDVVVGYLTAELDRTTRVVTIREVWVEDGAREIGAGEGLVSAALAWAITEGANAVDAYALPGARSVKNLYERLGLTARVITVRRDLG